MNCPKCKRPIDDFYGICQYCEADRPAGPADERDEHAERQMRKARRNVAIVAGIVLLFAAAVVAAAVFLFGGRGAGDGVSKDMRALGREILAACADAGLREQLGLAMSADSLDGDEDYLSLKQSAARLREMMGTPDEELYAYTVGRLVVALPAVGLAEVYLGENGGADEEFDQLLLTTVEQFDAARRAVEKAADSEALADAAALVEKLG
ncbi:hypothetical protein [Feifania hominis]|uniref:Uncharacterized protein n=1 Tax=Feifania hominis TaxID=2763660 RepID=A0A926HV31_9FIRM|nr:hypothetical protein [Feifania hominis]MBC8536570.1 hypothetical protein [Feifania hominis]